MLSGESGRSIRGLMEKWLELSRNKHVADAEEARVKRRVIIPCATQCFCCTRTPVKALLIAPKGRKATQK